MFETLAVFCLRYETPNEIIQRVVYVEKYDGAYDLVIAQAPRKKDARHFTDPCFIGKKEKFVSGHEAMVNAESLVDCYQKQGWLLVGGNLEQLAN
ncbi:hypothetical protein [Silvibacterium acidisoli]|uniref:hypothetical protein n=1 Tax=Acidobacteriaceae bacterium ZG23-2 TaxID=2883246 RepID=UPI00406C2023